MIFDYPVRFGDRLAEVAARGERLVRGTLRSLSQGELRAGWSELRRQTPRYRPPQGAPSSNRPIVYLAAIAWNYRFQRPQQLALALGQLGHPVLYVDGFLRSGLQPLRRLFTVGSGVSVLRLRVPGLPDPFRQSLPPQAVQALADVVQAGLRVPPRVVVTQLPFWGGLGIELSERLGARLVYDCLDLHAGFPGVPAEVVRAEDELLARADLVTVSSSSLGERAARFNNRVASLPNAVAIADFSEARPRAYQHRAPRVGYVGALGPWFDVDAVRQAARSRPAWRLRVAGRVEDDNVAALGALPNVDLLGEMPYQHVPEFLANTDVSIIPFVDSPLTRAVDPVKLYEALAAGVPVVSRRLPDLARWKEPCLYCYDSPGDLVPQIERALADSGPEFAATRRRRVAGETWTERARSLLRAVHEIGLNGGGRPAAILTDR